MFGSVIFVAREINEDSNNFICPLYKVSMALLITKCFLLRPQDTCIDRQVCVCIYIYVSTAVIIEGFLLPRSNWKQ